MSENPREERGLLIAAKFKLVQEKTGVWSVPSQSGPRKYKVHVAPWTPSCTCPDHAHAGHKCKHLFAVEWAVTHNGETTGGLVVGSVTVEVKKPTYRQNWPKYNEAQTSEKRMFLPLLRDLCAGLDRDEPPCRGRPRLPMSDAVFAMVYKVYSGTSARRFMSDLEDAREKGLISRTPHYNSILNYLEETGMTAILSDLIVRSSLPMVSVEDIFAVDSTGFSSSRFDRWYDHKYGRENKAHAWVKCHVMCGVRTNIVTSAVATNPFMHDISMLPQLVASTVRNFTVKEVLADKAYSSKAVLELITAHGATPYIPFKVNANPKGDDTFSRLYHTFSLEQEAFYAHYHLRSNAESTMAMMKGKFRDHLFSKTDTAMRNEVLCKVAAHNLCCLIGAIHELGIDPKLKELAA